MKPDNPMPRFVLPPENLLDGVGFGDFEAIGRETVDLIAKYAGVYPDDHVLDIGCGLGRIVQPLAELLTEGTYEGIDTVPDYVAFCKSIGLDPRRFHFQHTDVYSSFYNPKATVRAEQFRFPWPDRSFTLAIGTSVFTHLSAEATASYLRETFRVLQPGGRLFSSFFVLDGYALHGIEEYDSIPPFQFAIEHGRISDPANPELAIAFHSEWLLRLFLSIGWEIVAFERGKWRRPLTEGPSYQDLVVARRPYAG